MYGRSAETGRSPGASASGTGCLDSSRGDTGLDAGLSGHTPEISSSVVTPEGDKETIATFKSDDKPTEIVQFYQTKLQESGFKIEVASSGDQGGMIQAQDGERKRMLILNVNPGETGTMSRVVTVQKK